MNLAIEFGRFIVKRMFHRRYRFRFDYDRFDPKGKTSFFLVANHPSALDPLYVAMNIVRYPYPIANIFLYTDPKLKFLLTNVVKSIPKRKGQTDTRTIRAILEAYQKDHRSIMVFPEGNASYFGKSTPTDYASTAKIAKKVGVDVIAAKIDGGFLAAPRWGKYIKGSRVDVHYSILLTSERLKTMSIQEIASVIEEALTFDDFDWREAHDVMYPTKHRAQGLEHVIYWCPKCQGIQTIHTKGNDIHCRTCGHIASFDERSLLTGLPFARLTEWGDRQMDMIPGIIKEGFETKGVLKEIDFKRMRRRHIGLARVTYQAPIIWIVTKTLTLEINQEDITGIVMTEKNDISFDWKGHTYFITIDDPKLLLDVITHTKEIN